MTKKGDDDGGEVGVGDWAAPWRAVVLTFVSGPRAGESDVRALVDRSAGLVRFRKDAAAVSPSPPSPSDDDTGNASAVSDPAGGGGEDKAAFTDTGYSIDDGGGGGGDGGGGDGGGTVIAEAEPAVVAEAETAVDGNDDDDDDDDDDDEEDKDEDDGYSEPVRAVETELSALEDLVHRQGNNEPHAAEVRGDAAARRSGSAPIATKPARRVCDRPRHRHRSEEALPRMTRPHQDLAA